jgi:hypothetical protein
MQIMSFEKLPALEGKDIKVGCPCCSTAAIVAPMNMLIAVGFGSADVTKNGEAVYSESVTMSDSELWSVQDAENAARLEPDADWRITKFGPLHGETFQRHGENLWVCVESNQGFA